MLRGRGALGNRERRLKWSQAGEVYALTIPFRERTADLLVGVFDAAGAEFVARDNGAPLVRPDDVALSLTAPVVAVLTSRQSLARARPLSPLEFTAAVRSEALRARLP
mgnify:CR=1 FL=1